MLSRSEGNCIEYLHKSCLKGGEARVGLELWLAKKQPSLVCQGGWLWWWGVFGHVCGLDNVRILSVVRQDSEKSCFSLNLS